MARSNWLVLVMAGILCVAGCHRVESQRREQMTKFAEKLHAYVTKALDEFNISNAKNVAIASVLFAREMQYAIGKPAVTPQNPKGKEAESGERQMDLVDFKVIRQRIESLILDPHASVERPSAKTYNSLLGWALSEEDMKTLKDIRDNTGYWASFQKNELSHD